MEQLLKCIPCFTFHLFETSIMNILSFYLHSWYPIPGILIHFGPLLSQILSQDSCSGNKPELHCVETFLLSPLASQSIILRGNILVEFCKKYQLHIVFLTALNARYILNKLYLSTFFTIIIILFLFWKNVMPFAYHVGENFLYS